MKKFILVLNVFHFFYFFLIISESVDEPEYHDEYSYDTDSDSDFIHRGADIFEDDKIKVKHSGYLPANLGRFPFMVSVFNGRNKEITCGGIILNELMVLTAGYCIFESKNQPEMISVLGGVVDMKDNVRDQWRYATEIIFFNKSYLNMPYLAGIKVNTPFYLHFMLQAKPIPSTPFSSNNFCYLCSWHLKDKIRTAAETFNEPTIISSILKYIRAYPINRDLCHRIYKEYKNEIVNLDEIFCLPDKPIIIDETKHRSNEPGCIGSDGTVLSCINQDGVLIPVGISTSVPGSFFCVSSKFSVPTSFFDFGKFENWIKEKLFESPQDFDKMQYSKSSSRQETQMHSNAMKYF